MCIHKLFTISYLASCKLQLYSYSCIIIVTITTQLVLQILIREYQGIYINIIAGYQYFYGETFYIKDIDTLRY